MYYKVLSILLYFYNNKLFIINLGNKFSPSKFPWLSQESQIIHFQRSVKLLLDEWYLCLLQATPQLDENDHFLLQIARIFFFIYYNHLLYQLSYILWNKASVFSQAIILKYWKSGKERWWVTPHHHAHLARIHRIWLSCPSSIIHVSIVLQFQQ